MSEVVESRTLDITPTPRSVAILCIEILEHDNHPNQAWAREQLLDMIIEDWPEVTVGGQRCRCCGLAGCGL